MKQLTLQVIAKACNGILQIPDGAEYDPEREVTAITTDSRTITCGCLFVAITGNRSDGHAFIEQAVRDGAYAVIGERELNDCPCPYIRTASSLQAVQKIARAYLEILNIPVIGITGSVGKTSTKEMIASILSQRYHVLKTEGNFNNALGLPLTIFRLREEHEIAILEMGISDFGEMHRLAEIARPETCVITNIGTCHLEQLGDRDGVLRAKSEIFGYLPATGHIVLNGEDDKLAQIQRDEETVRVGFSDAFPVYADEIKPLGFAGSRCRLHTPSGSFAVTVPHPGMHTVSNALAGTAVGMLYGLTHEEICRGIERYTTISGRFRVIHSGELTVIDDCYNANPMSMKASLNLLQQAEGRRVALLGDMGELGKDAARLHAEVGETAAALGIDAVFCAGALTEHLTKAIHVLDPEVLTAQFPDTDSLLNALPDLIRPGDTVLVKASHFMGFDRIVGRLTSEKEAE